MRPNPLRHLRCLPLMLALGCGGEDQTAVPPPVAPPPPAPVTTPARGTFPTGFRMPELGAATRADREKGRANTSLHAHSGPRPRGGMGSPIYDRIGPATVFIEDGHGSMGSGVLISEDGFVLTAYHVVANGTLDGLHLSVNVQLGKLAPPEGEAEQRNADASTNLVMTKSGDPYKAYLHAVDMLDDVAILKLTPKAGETLPRLPFLKIAPSDPPVGSTVQCMGHPGMGGLWTIRDGKVEGVRDEAELLSRSTDTEHDEDAKNMIEQVKAFDSQANAGKLLQVSCAFVHGDSGGPEVNDAGEIVGLNRRYDKDDSGVMHFAIPSAVLRRVAQSVSTTPIDMLPDPWRDGGQTAELSDASLDGIPETLAIVGFEQAERQVERTRSAFIVDVGQTSFTGDPPPIAELRQKRALHADFTLFEDMGGDRKIATYDTDGDGKPDVVFLQDDGKTAGYRLTAGQAAQADPSLGDSLYAPALFPEGTKRDRFARILSSLGSETGATMIEVDAIKGGGTPRTLKDLDGDGKPDMLVSKGAYSSSSLIDAHGSWLGALKPGPVDKGFSLDGAKPDVSFLGTHDGVIVNIASATPGTFDVRIHPSTFPYGTADKVERMTMGQWQPVTDAVGRKVLRPSFFGSQDVWKRVAKFDLMNTLLATDDGLGSFPAIADDVTSFTPINKKGFEKKIVIAEGRGSDGLLIDVDGHTMLTRKDKTPVEEVAQKGELKAHFGWLARGGREWTFYDTDKDGKFDLILFSDDPTTGESTLAYRIGKSGAVEPDAAASHGKLIRWSVFKGRGALVAPQFKALLKTTQIFKERAVESLK